MVEHHNRQTSQSGHFLGPYDLVGLAKAAAQIRGIIPLVALALLIIAVLIWEGLQQAQLMGGSATFGLLMVGLAIVFLILLITVVLTFVKERTTGTQALSPPTQVLMPEVCKIRISKEKAFVLAIADVPDYAAAVSRLTALFATQELDVDSVTAIGVYGSHDILIELICGALKKKQIIAKIKEVLGPKNLLSGLPALTIPEVTEVAKINNCLIGGVDANNTPIGVPLKNSQFRTGDVTIDNEVFPTSSSNDLLEAIPAPYVVAYLFVEVRSNNVPDGPLLLVYSHLLEKVRADKGIKGLFLLSSAVVLKSVFLTTDYYSYASFTKRIDAVIRGLGYSDVLEVRTVMGAEVIKWS